MRFIFIVFSLSSLCLIAHAQDQKFLNFQSARIAFEKHNDCDGAVRLLKPIHEDFKDDMSFVHLYAKVLKCLDKSEEALAVYKKFNALAKDPSIDEEIAELNYTVSKLKFAEDEKFEAADLTGNWIVKMSAMYPLVKDNDIIRITKISPSTFKVYLSNNEYLGSLKTTNSWAVLKSALYKGTAKRFEKESHSSIREPRIDHEKFSESSEYAFRGNKSDDDNLILSIMRYSISYEKDRKGRENVTVYNDFAGFTHYTVDPNDPRRLDEHSDDHSLTLERRK